MPLQVTSAVRQAILDGDQPYKLVEIRFSQVTLYLTTAGTDINWSGATWLSNGFIVDEPRGDLNRELRSTSDEITITGVDQTVAALLLNEPQQGRTVIVRDAFLNPSGGVIPDPYIVDEYVIDNFSGSVDRDEALINITLAGEFADFDFRNGIRTTDASLQRLHPGDRLFQYATAVSKELKNRWGGK